MFDVFRRRLPTSAIAWFLGAGLAGAAAFVAVRAQVERIEATRPDVGPPSPVVVAATDLPRGSTIGPDSLRVVDVPSTLVPPGAVMTLEQATGRVLVADLAEGEALTATRLAVAGTGPVAAQVPPGLRAFVLSVGPPPGAVRPGDHVDVVATYGANGGRPYTDTVATALEVLDVVDGALLASTGTSGAPTGPPIVVLADPLTVERLARAASLALLAVAIVGADEPVTPASTDPITPPPPTAPAPAPTPAPAPIATAESTSAPNP
ncbi:MAG: Flp pilus assembly protein CpaB [Actinomycetota bacterium]